MLNTQVKQRIIGKTNHFKGKSFSYLSSSLNLIFLSENVFQFLKEGRSGNIWHRVAGAFFFLSIDSFFGRYIVRTLM